MILWLTARQALDGAQFGRFTFYLSLFAVLDALSDMGTAQVATQQTAGSPAATYGVLRTARRIRVRAALVGVALVGGSAFLLGERDATYIFLASLYPITNALELTAIVFKNQLRWGIPVAVRAGSNTAALAAVWTLVVSGIHAPAAYLLAIAGTSALANFTLHALSRAHIARGSEHVTVTNRAFFRKALPLGVGALCQQAYFYVDNLFIRALVSEEALGHYNVAARFLSLSIMVAIYATMTALPWFSRAHARGELPSAILRLGVPLFALGALVAGVLLPFAEQVLRLFGEDFQEASASLCILLLATVAIHVGSVRVTALVAMGASRAVLVVTVAALGVNLLGNAVLVPTLGIDGAAISTLATESSVAIGAGIALRRAGIDPLGGKILPWLAAPLALALGAALSLATGLT